MIGPAFDSVLSAAAGGAPWALELLYRDLCGPVTAYLRLHGAAEPDDLASEVFISVLTGLRGFSGDEGALRAWVFTIAHRRLVDAWRRAGRRPLAHDDGGPALLELAGGDVEAEAVARLAAGELQEACSALPHDQRAVVLLRVLADLSTEEVARLLDRTPASVKGLQRRALLTLSEQLAARRGPRTADRTMTETR